MALLGLFSHVLVHGASDGQYQFGRISSGFERSCQTLFELSRVLVWPVVASDVDGEEDVDIEGRTFSMTMSSIDVHSESLQSANGWTRHHATKKRRG
jgi:hypothetical protein